MDKDKIILLDEHTINQIAAGEVVEAPASVVKELVENSLDAGSARIDIGIRDGGLGEIKVSDDGRGIQGEELEKAFRRYGTSKLSTIEDLYSLETMGFRGEALASIAAVSRVTLLSKPGDSPVGWSVRVEGGAAQEKQPAALKAGTTVKVEDLFFNAPVRQNFLRSRLKETAEIVSIVEKLALSRPDVAFELRVDDRLALKTRGNGDLRELASLVYSFGAEKGMLPVDGERDGMRVHGLIGDSRQYRASREYLHFFVNGRYVRSKALGRAVEEAFRNRLPIGRYPLGFLYLQLPPYLVEVNIHPRKLEVKIDREREVCALMTGLVEAELLRKPVREEAAAAAAVWPASVREEAGLPPRREESLSVPGAEQLSLDLGEEELRKNPFHPLTILGTLGRTYVLAKVGEALLIFDQHAAHERIHFEAARREFAAAGFRTQLLLQPVLVTLSPSDALKVIERIGAIADAGVLLESFGEDAFLIRGLPLGIPGEEASAEFLQTLLDRLESGDPDHLRDYMLEKASCVRSVKAGEEVGRDELRSLILRLGECEFPLTCPHGRPTFLRYGEADLEKLFLRRI